MKPAVDDPGDPDLHMTLAGRELTIRDRYETASIVNDVLIAIEFFVGSIFFFSWVEEVASKDIGVWLFVIGSAQLMIRPAIRLARRVSLRRLAAAGSHRAVAPGGPGGPGGSHHGTPHQERSHEDSHDF